jgi:hypothetical protein
MDEMGRILILPQGNGVFDRMTGWTKGWTEWTGWTKNNEAKRWLFHGAGSGSALVVLY